MEQVQGLEYEAETWRMCSLKFLGFRCASIPFREFYEVLLVITTLWVPAVPSTTAHDTYGHQMFMNALSFGAREVVEIGVGIFVIVKSRKIAGFLIKDE